MKVVQNVPRSAFRVGTLVLVICGGCTSAPVEVPREKVRIESFNEYHRRIGDLGERWIVTSNRQYYVKTNAPVNP